MRKYVLTKIIICLVVSFAVVTAFAATEDETVVKKTLETFAAKAAVRDSRGMAELFSEDAVMNYFYGTGNEPKKAEGRMKIYIVFSFGNIVSYKVENIKITVVDGDLAKATGFVTVRATAFGFNFRRESDVTWNLKRANGSWLIFLYDFTLAPMIRE